MRASGEGRRNFKSATLVMRFALALAAMMLAGPAAADCSSIDAEIRAALSAGTVDRYDRLREAMLREPACDAAYRDQAGRAMARSALTGLSTDSGPEAIAAITRFGRPWQLLVALGDSYYARRDWAQAVPVYEEALDDMRDTAANPKAPPEEIERRVYKRAVEARALAPTYVVTRQFRGKKTGLADPNFRNFTAEAVPVPVRFETDSAALTPDGITAVEDIYAYVSAAAPDYVAIVGHTDPRGTDAHNDDLSLRRATTVRDQLIALGYGGKIETTGKGERERFVPDDPSKYSEDELFAFDRRVEYRTAQ
jgi:outer membrane protein OmpA-like peptidoglycan-associated protein